jgi:hopanoid biosynthesis associated radical SAM protein HpnH
MHPQIDEIVRQLIARKKFVFLCTNALLMPKKIEKFKPSPYFAWVVHIDGLRERHDESVCKEGVFDEAVAAIKDAKRRGFKVGTNTTVFNTDTPHTVIDALSSTTNWHRPDQISPAYACRREARPGALPVGRDAVVLGVRRQRREGRWRLQPPPPFLDFPEGKTDFGAAWASIVLAVCWQRPFHQMNDGYVKTWEPIRTDGPSTGARTAVRELGWRTAAGPSVVPATMSLRSHPAPARRPKGGLGTPARRLEEGRLGGPPEA